LLHTPLSRPWESANGNGESWEWEFGLPISTIPHSRLPIPVSTSIDSDPFDPSGRNPAAVT